MASIEKLYRRIEQNPKNVAFNDLLRVAKAFGFVLDRTRGSHHVFRHPAAGSRLNLQPDGKNAKPYQVRQFLGQIERYNLAVTKD